MTSIVLITGASGGIGRALAHQLHSQGLRVAVVGRDMDRLTNVDAVLRIAADTTTPEGAAQAIAICQESLGAAPSLLAHCVGSTLIAPLHRTSVQAYREVMRINLDSAVFMFQAWVTALQGGPGAAVMASSVVARIGVANHEAIAAAKGGGEALVNPSGGWANAGGDVLNESNHIVVRAFFDFPNIVDIEGPLRADLGCILFRDRSQLRHRLAGEGFDLEPNFQFSFLSPKGPHFRQ